MYEEFQKKTKKGSRRPPTPYPILERLLSYYGSTPALRAEIITFADSLSTQEQAWVTDVLLDDYEIPFHELKILVEECRGNLFKKPKPESTHVDDINTTDTSGESEQNVHFTDEQPQTDLVIARMTTDPTYDRGVQESALLADFLRRPIKIGAITWAVNAVTPFLTVLNPWEEFLSDARVLNKIETFKLLHATLKVKVITNGSPFHYGRVFVGVRPTRFDNNTAAVDMASFRTQATYLDNYTASARSLRSGVTLYSQRPHVFVDPCTNQPQHIDWPFFAATSWIDLINPDTIDRMGRLEIWELNQLRHSNGATDPVTISIFAWLEDVTLTGITKYAPVIESNVKSKKKGKGDEYASGGAISTPASAVAAAAQYFTEIPYIGKFAMATRLGAGAVADIARLFGFSRPAIINDVTIMRPQTTGNMAHYVGGEPLIKLSLDPKQELTVDPSTVGLSGEDQMSIGYLVKKEAWIDVIPWAQDTLPTFKLYSVRVHPMVAPIDDEVVTGVDRTWQTPLSFASRPFQYWSGSLRYRFQIVCSNMHRGRLLFQYDPHAEAAPLVADFNNRYSQVVDISEMRDFTLEIKWSQPAAFASLQLDPSLTWSAIGAVGVLPISASCNGVLCVYVLNELASPIDDNGTATSIDINVFISAGDDYEVRAPLGAISTWAYARNDITVGPPVTTESNITSSENAPAQDTHIMMNGSHVTCDPNCSMVYFGETVVSIRSLMKRYNFHRTLTTQSAATAASSMALNSFTLFNMPVGPGPTYGSSIISTLVSTPGYNIVAMTYPRYFMQGYIGWRGGMRWKMIYLSNAGTWANIAVARSGVRTTTESVDTLTVRGAGVTDVGTIRRYLSGIAPYNSSAAGFSINSTHVNNSLEYELPMYTPYRYVEVNEGIEADTANYQTMFNNGAHKVSYVATVSATSVVQNYFEAYVSVGEDFSLFFFIGASPLVPSDVDTVVPS